MSQMANQHNQAKIDMIIFNLDGTLIDASESYRRTIEVTVNNYIKGSYVTQDDVRVIKSVVGYSNDWDTSAALVTLVQQGIPKEQWAEKASQLLPINRKSELFKELYGIFQTVYLGSDQYQAIERRFPPFPYSPGLITYQKSFVEKELVKQLKEKGYKIAIVTECPRAEVKLMLEAEGLYGKEFFEQNEIIAQEDTTSVVSYNEGLIKAKERIGGNNPVYIGDTVTDVEAARKANMPCIFVGNQNEQTSSSGFTINEILRLFVN